MMLPGAGSQDKRRFWLSQASAAMPIQQLWKVPLIIHHMAGSLHAWTAIFVTKPDNAVPDDSFAYAVQHNDTVMLDIETGKVKDFIKFGVGNLCMITGGRNNGRVGTIVHQEKHKGSFEIIHIKDAAGALFWLSLPFCGVLLLSWWWSRLRRRSCCLRRLLSVLALMLALQPYPCTETDAVCFHRLPAGQDFATRINNVFVIGRGDKPLISLPKGKGELLSDLADCLWPVHVT